MNVATEVTTPPGVVTEILPVVAAVGTEVTMDVFDRTVKGAAVPLKATEVAPRKLFPVTVTDVPRPPVVGEKEVRVGAGAKVKAADTDAALLRLTVQVAPTGDGQAVQPENNDPAAGFAVSTTEVP